MLEKLRFPKMQKVLPLVYDDSLSYYEQVCKLTKKMNDIIEEVNRIPEIVAEALAPFEAEFRQELLDMHIYVTEQSNELRQYIFEETEKLKTDIQLFQEDIQRQQTKFEHDIELRIAQIKVELEREMQVFRDEINERIVNIIDYINNQLNLIRMEMESRFIKEREWTKKQLAELQKQIDELQFELPEMYNPTKGENDEIVNTIVDVYNADRYFGATAGAWDNANVSCEEFENKGVTALRFDTYSAIDFTNSTLWHMRNPFSGRNILIADMMYIVVDMLMNKAETVLSCTSFDGLGLTANDFDSKDGLSAYSFDFTSKVLFG